MTGFDYLKIAKWALIVLVAGFIGQFGKSLAKHFMEKTRLKKKSLAGKTEETVHTTGSSHIENKPGIKKPQPGAEQVISPEEESKQKKKLSKVLAKQKKKESKVLEKQGNL
jgi:hypothetical protein